MFKSRNNEIQTPKRSKKEAVKQFALDHSGGLIIAGIGVLYILTLAGHVLYYRKNPNISDEDYAEMLELAKQMDEIQERSRSKK